MLKTPFYPHQSLLCICDCQFLHIGLWSWPESSVKCNVPSVPFEHRGGVFSPSYPQFWGPLVHSSRSRLFFFFYLCHILDEGGVLSFSSFFFWLFFYFFLLMPHTHTVAAWEHYSGIQTLSSFSFCFSGCAENVLFFFFLFLLPAIPRWHSMPFTEKKKNRVTAEGIVCFHFVLHCLLKKQILKNKIKKATKNK